MCCVCIDEREGGGGREGGRGERERERERERQRERQYYTTMATEMLQYCHEISTHGQ